jgi:manganese/zinc/iron transport system permease protein
MIADGWLAVQEGLTYPFARRALLGCVVAALLAGPAGVLLLVRRQALLGDTTSHATLPGIVLAIVVTQSTSHPAVWAGAAATGVAGALWGQWSGQGPRRRPESGLAIAMVSFYGLGTLLWSVLEAQLPWDALSLRAVLLGNAAGLTDADLLGMLVLTLAMLIAVVAGWRPLVLEAFDPVWTSTTASHAPALRPLSTFALALAAVVIGRSMGVLLVTGLLVLPAQAALLLTRRMPHAVLVATGFGLCAAVLGDIASLAVPKVPTGPAVILVAGLLFVGAVIVAGIRERARTTG